MAPGVLIGVLWPGAKLGMWPPGYAAPLLIRSLITTVRPGCEYWKLKGRGVLPESMAESAVLRTTKGMKMAPAHVGKELCVGRLCVSMHGPREITTSCGVCAHAPSCARVHARNTLCGIALATEKIIPRRARYFCMCNGEVRASITQAVESSVGSRYRIFRTATRKVSLDLGFI